MSGAFSDPVVRMGFAVELMEEANKAIKAGASSGSKPCLCGGTVSWTGGKGRRGSLYMNWRCDTCDSQGMT